MTASLAAWSPSCGERTGPLPGDSTLCQRAGARLLANLTQFGDLASIFVTFLQVFLGGTWTDMDGHASQRASPARLATKACRFGAGEAGGVKEAGTRRRNGPTLGTHPKTPSSRA